MSTIITIVLFLIFAAFTIPTFFFIRWIILKSTKKLTPEEQEDEKSKKRAKLIESSKKLIPWKPEYISKISNNLEYHYIKGFSQKFNGFIKSKSDEKLIVYRRTDRGMKVNSRIMAATSAFEVYYELNERINKIYFNDKYFGQIEDNKVLKNAKGEIIGAITRDQNRASSYSLIINGKSIADIVKNSDRRTFVKNRFYDSDYRISDFNPLYTEREVQPEINIPNVKEDMEQEEYNWVLSVSIFEVVYYGLDFTM